MPECIKLLLGAMLDEQVCEVLANAGDAQQLVPGGGVDVEHLGGRRPARGEVAAVGEGDEAVDALVTAVAAAAVGKAVWTVKGSDRSSWTAVQA